MNQAQDADFFKWILDNNEWRADYVHKVGKATVGFQISHQTTRVQKHVILELANDISVYATLEAAKSDAKPPMNQTEPMTMMSIPTRLVPQYTALLQQLIANERK